jgi:cytochrome bd-type quinol oxidase subunit 2
MQQRRHSTVDITLTAILSVVAGLAAFGTVGFSFFFVMAADSCNEHCAYDALNAAYIVTWGGVAVAVLLAVAGVIVAAVRGWLMWIWPAVALLLIVVALGIGVHLANAVMHHN